MASFAPKKFYCPPKTPFVGSSTYQLSYYDGQNFQRPQPLRPRITIRIGDGKFADETTAKLSYQPVWEFVKPSPIIPRKRSMIPDAPMQSITTVRHDFVKKYEPPPEKIIPTGNIRTCQGQLDDRTTNKLSYMKYDFAVPTDNFKPIRKYEAPKLPFEQETTQKLSFLPVTVGQKEFFPWAQKPAYKPPVATMDEKTTYSLSYLENCASKEMPILPPKSYLLPFGAEFTGKTIYNESYLHSGVEPVIPIVHKGNIVFSKEKMDPNTTSKLSYQAVRGVKRNPIMPYQRNMIGDGPMQCVTTVRHDFTPKWVPRPELVIPSENIRSSNQPIDDKTTSALSYMRPERNTRVESFKPISRYSEPMEEFERETTNKLSYQPWETQPKERLPWTEKRRYEPPRESMIGDTVYNMSFPTPGYYISECLVENCSCSKTPIREN